MESPYCRGWVSDQDAGVIAIGAMFWALSGFQLQKICRRFIGVRIETARCLVPSGYFFEHKAQAEYEGSWTYVILFGCSKEQAGPNVLE